MVAPSAWPRQPELGGAKRTKPAMTCSSTPKRTCSSGWARAVSPVRDRQCRSSFPDLCSDHALAQVGHVLRAASADGLAWAMPPADAAVARRRSQAPQAQAAVVRSSRAACTLPRCLDCPSLWLAAALAQHLEAWYSGCKACRRLPGGHSTCGSTVCGAQAARSADTDCMTLRTANIHQGLQHARWQHPRTPAICLRRPAAQTIFSTPDLQGKQAM